MNHNSFLDNRLIESLSISFNLRNENVNENIFPNLAQLNKGKNANQVVVIDVTPTINGVYKIPAVRELIADYLGYDINIFRMPNRRFSRNNSIAGTPERKPIRRVSVQILSPLKTVR